MGDTETRKQALDLAIRCAAEIEPAEDTVKRAEAFYKFITGAS